MIRRKRDASRPKVNQTLSNKAPWFTKAGAATGIVPISHFIGDRVFALKRGGYGCLLSLDGIDPESRTDEDLDVRVRSVEAALRGLPPGACLYQYTRVMAGFDLPRQENYADTVTESSRATGLDSSIQMPASAVSTCIGV